MSTPKKPLPPAQPYQDDDEVDVRHSADEIRDESPVKSLGEAVSEAVLGAGEDATTDAAATRRKAASDGAATGKR